MTRPRRNVAASVAQRLLDKSRATGQIHDLILRRYAMESILWRIAGSVHARKFVLKGAMVYLAWGIPLPRPTKDMDLLGFCPPDPPTIMSIFVEILEQQGHEDGLSFETSDIQVTQIRQEDPYTGVRVKITAHLLRSRIPLQVDVGFGDALFPEPSAIRFPRILSEDEPTIACYRCEHMVAEKFHAMVTLGLDNTRMKDFFDVWFLASNFKFERAILAETIRHTFARRGMILPSRQPLALSRDFLENPSKQTQWNAFLNRSGLTGAPSLTGAGNLSWQLIEPCILKRNSDGIAPSHWLPDVGWR